MIRIIIEISSIIATEQAFTSMAELINSEGVTGLNITLDY